MSTDNADGREPGSGDVLFASLAACGRFDGQSEFQLAVRTAFDGLALTDCPQVWLCDPDFAAWPIGERSVIEAWTSWARAQTSGHCAVMAASFDRFRSDHPRWVGWRTNWSHRVKCLQVPDELATGLPSWLYIPRRILIQKMDPIRCSGVMSNDPRRMLACHESCDAISQRSEESFPATTLGL